ncbi:hypothetical protein AB6A40_008479, partial [Gnathostoma spinigerum]
MSGQPTNSGESDDRPSTSIASTSKMPENAQATVISDTSTRTADAIDMLAREAEELRQKLEQERQKLNDIPIEQAAERLEPLTTLSIKQRRILKGHAGKVLCMDWSQDKRH